MLLLPEGLMCLSCLSKPVRGSPLGWCKQLQSKLDRLAQLHWRRKWDLLWKWGSCILYGGTSFNVQADMYTFVRFVINVAAALRIADSFEWMEEFLICYITSKVVAACSRKWWAIPGGITELLSMPNTISIHLLTEVLVMLRIRTGNLIKDHTLMLKGSREEVVKRFLFSVTYGQDRYCIGIHILKMLLVGSMELRIFHMSSSCQSWTCTRQSFLQSVCHVKEGENEWLGQSNMLIWWRKFHSCFQPRSTCLFCSCQAELLGCCWQIT